MRITVTGASGFLGAWTVRALAAAGHDVTAVVRRPQPWRLHGVVGVSVVEGHPDAWPEMVAATGPETLMLLDWDGVSAQGRLDMEVQRPNLARWKAVAGAALASGAGRIVGLGSQAECGPRADVIGEDDEPSPVTPYGRTKADAAELLHRLAEAAGARAVWARVFSVYGPLDNEGVLLAHIADAATAGRAVPLSSAGQAWSYLYAADSAEALALLAVEANAPDRCNVAHPESPPLRHIVDAFAARVSGVELNYGAVPDQAGGAQLRASTTRLQALHWQPKVSLADGLGHTARWLRGGAVADPFGRALLPDRPARVPN